MKNVIMMIIMAVALVALPAMAQDWQSTSTMQGSGSAYSAQVTAVGAAEVTEMATTTSSTPNNGPHRAKKGDFGPGGNDGGYQDPNFPIGDAWPMLLFAAIFAVVITLKKHKKVMMKKNLKTVLFITALMMNNGAWADTTLPVGTYIFDLTTNFSASNSDHVAEFNVFDPSDIRANITFDNTQDCNSGLSESNGKQHFYMTSGFNAESNYMTYLVLVNTEAYVASASASFFSVKYNNNWDPVSWAKFGTYTLSPVTGTDDVYLCIIGKSGSFEWSTDKSKLPACSGITPSNPKLNFSAGSNGSITTQTAGGEYVANGAAVVTGTPINLVATPSSGYAFYGWSNASGDIVSEDANYLFFMPSSSITLTALFYADNTDPAINGCPSCFRITP